MQEYPRKYEKACPAILQILKPLYFANVSNIFYIMKSTSVKKIQLTWVLIVGEFL